MSVAGAALRDLSPATIEFGEGAAGFAINRRAAINPNGPVDHRVPVLKIADPAGKIRGIVFGYACHNTTLTGEFYQLSGDYAGIRGGGAGATASRRDGTVPDSMRSGSESESAQHSRVWRGSTATRWRTKSKK